ncbi:serine hydrolase domain-containing protein [Ruegeria atlantica]|uniref:6-aminohexanoate-dimer hydrolase n=1 Tax=Ruegeria atlantica TaxID=81569 RepID=A0A0P1EBR4_9RHOB|nr:serine hydrolase [Ruegeria atlantica]CUH46963.1 6-aminohexanoate-dimer hydrolase [Ruegeria atlantica]
MSRLRVIPNPDLTVGPDNKQRWNQPAHRRHGFHNAHRLFRRSLMVRSRNVLMLETADQDLTATVPALADLLAHPAFSAFCCLRGGQVIMEQAAPDFSTTQPHSIQSITKLHIHLIMGQLIGQGLVLPEAEVAQYLPDIGTGYREATVQALLDMAVSNDFSEDYDDPHADCYDEEIALGWRLPAQGQDEITLKDFVAGVTGFREKEARTEAEYKSANTDVLTLVAAAVSRVPLAALIEQIADAVGYEGAFHISLSKDGYPAFSGGGCLSARDLARFGLLLAREGADLFGSPPGNAAFLRQTLTRAAPALTPPKDWLRYSNQTMTDGRVVGHAGYGGQFLMVDTVTGTSCAFLSVLENDAGYDETYMSTVARVLRQVCLAEAE